MYQTCFELYSALSNPWGNDIIDFPEEDFEAALVKECEAMMNVQAPADQPAAQPM